MADSLYTQRFSAGYDLVCGAEVTTVNDDEALIDMEMQKELERVFGEPLTGFIGGLHYQFKPTRSIPKHSVAVPMENHDDPDAFLVKV